MANDNLWGVLPDKDHRQTAKQILKQQAAFLSESTRNHLEGVVRTTSWQELVPDQIGCEMSINVPNLGNYRYDVVRVAYDPLVLYPVTIWDRSTGVSTDASDEQELLQELRSILRSENTHNVIASLLRQAEDDDPDLRKDDEVSF